MDSGRRRILIMTAVSEEREAVLRGINGKQNIDVILTGVGPVKAAASTARILAKKDYDLVVSAGIAGGFKEMAEIGSLVVANKIVSADLGAEGPEGFLSLDQLGFGASTTVPCEMEQVDQLSQVLTAAGLSVHIGPIVTVSTVTGSDLTAKEMVERVPGAVAEAMEGYGVAVAAKEYGLPVMEVRAISNLVGPRDRSAWRIKEALTALEVASQVLAEVFS
ncbi:futalosine hydrolase [Ammoniphilus resinae]|uniref:Futalosine hydrolase n=1 Tax=Ammoniphilus resinae TaxID=861532 RepID=A0ABS4GN44_9BACL|nr:futalosine hydrolase [Ammoniphilus resinae]MBP1931688.1 futalosine hydrolase [Ammoniphilus resinae]